MKKMSYGTTNMLIRLIFSYLHSSYKCHVISYKYAQLLCAS